MVLCHGTLLIPGTCAQNTAAAIVFIGHHERRLVNEIQFKMSAKFPSNSSFRNSLFRRQCPQEHLRSRDYLRDFQLALTGEKIVSTMRDQRKQTLAAGVYLHVQLVALTPERLRSDLKKTRCFGGISWSIHLVHKVVKAGLVLVTAWIYYIIYLR